MDLPPVPSWFVKSPPWHMNCLMMRWNVDPRYPKPLAWVHSCKKFSGLGRAYASSRLGVWLRWVNRRQGRRGRGGVRPAPRSVARSHTGGQRDHVGAQLRRSRHGIASRAGAHPTVRRPLQTAATVDDSVSFGRSYLHLDPAGLLAVDRNVKEDARVLLDLDLGPLGRRRVRAVTLGLGIAARRRALDALERVLPEPPVLTPDWRPPRLLLTARGGADPRSARGAHGPVLAWRCVARCGASPARDDAGRILVWLERFTLITRPFSSAWFMLSMAAWASSASANCTKPNPRWGAADRTAQRPRPRRPSPSLSPRLEGQSLRGFSLAARRPRT